MRTFAARVILAALLALVARGAVAATLAEAVPGIHDSVLAAIAHARDRYLSASVAEDREYLGAVLVDSLGRFHTTLAIGEPGHGSVTFRVRVPRHLRVAAYWHTHGAPGYARELFSRDDASLVARTGVPFYLITPAGDIRRLDPESLARSGPRHPRGSVLSLPRGARSGEVVAHASNL